MKKEIVVPTMGESISEATIGSLIKKTGQTVEENAEIIELETEKVNQVLYAPCAGVINWSVAEGDTVAVGDLIGFVDSEGKGESTKVEKKVEEKKVEKKEVKEEAVATTRIRQKEFVADLFKEEAKEEKQQATAYPAQSSSEGLVRRKMTKIRKTIAARLVHSLHESAMLTTFNEVDMTEVMTMRTKYQERFLEKHGVKLGFMSFFVKAVSEALKSYPDFNAFIEGDEIVERASHDIGIAVGTDRGLMVPVLRSCEGKSFAEIEKEIFAYAAKARSGKMAIADLEGGGFTITNGGVYGSLLSTPILNPPQVGILGMHKIIKRPVVIEDQIVIRPMMYLALSYDHRMVDGKEAVLFLVRVKEILEDPARLMFVETE